MSQSVSYAYYGSRRRRSVCSKHALKCIKVRMVAIRNKKQAVVRFLKKDVADLIASGHETNAFRRFVEKVWKKSFTREKKLQLMQDIAEEHSVRWDAKAFDHQTTSDPMRGKHGPNSASDVRREQAEMEEAKDIHVISASLGTRQACVKARRDHGGTCEADELECGVRGSPEKKGVVVSVNGRDVEENGRAAYLIPPYVKPKIHGDPVTAADHDTNEGGEDAVLHGGEKPRPVSVRRKLRKPRIGETDDGENYVKEKSADGEGKRRPAYDEADHNAASGGQYEDEEEMALDKRLLHYSRKGTAEEGSEGRRRAGAEHFGNGGKVHPLPRGALPPPVPSESVNPAAEGKAAPGATSMRPDPVDANGGRVHPRLPDYDQLAARFAALKRT
ncbi:hypothetical protein BHM03_00054803 [Ensete ventricosum]|nr:hypothetical protein BHM03_00054803 [Ensete ventricosum]